MTGGAVHSLGVAGAVVCAVAYAAFTVVGRRRERAARRRGALLLAAGAGKRRRWPSGVDAGVRRWAAPAGAAAVGWVLVGGLTGCLTAVAAAYGTWRWQESHTARDAGAVEVEAAVTTAQLPLAADLLAACLCAGAGPMEAAEAVGESMGGPVGDRLARTAGEIRLGGEPAEAWGRFAEIPGAGPLARCLDRAGTTGAPVAEAVARLAEALRAERSSAAVARAQRAGVLITAPVGLCFLPAFLAIGVAPVVIGLATGLLSAG
ncbi:type II secretion system F family protein [Streptomyces fulvorobeus]|nr:type II secretion system F family protein [Streptomyces fulvorobeus]